MNGFLRLFVIALIATTLVRCSMAPTDDSNAGGEAAQDFATADSGSSDEASAPSASSDDAIEKELNAAEGKPAQQATDQTNDQAADQASSPADQSTDQAAADQPAAKDDFAEFDDNKQTQQAEAPAPQPPQVEPAPQEEPPAAEPPAVVAEPAPAPEPPAPQVAETPAQKVHIKDIRFQANDGGGAVVISADGPMTFQTRVNEDTHQFVIEIPNASLPAKLKRSLNTKDMNGGIGAIDAYQSKETTHVVVQLRDGASEPTVNAEGNALLVTENMNSSATVAQSSPPATTSDTSAAPQEPATNQILNSMSLQEFLSGNMQFYGKKISLETSDMDVRDVFKLIADESGVNLVLSDEVKGNISLKLRQVPWDQALVMIMKAKKLGYTRSGNVIRIAPMVDLRTEEDDAVRMALAKKATDPLKVRLIPISYAKIDDLKTQVLPFLSDRGKVVGDTRTSSLVVTDVAENIDRVVKLIQAIDVPPPQVLIEGKIVEATDSFQRSIGVQWSASGQPMILGSNGKSNIVSTLGPLNVTPGTIGASSANIAFNLGTLDILGSLNATLNLFESQGLVKVLSSPRILTLQNEPAEISQSTELPLIQTNNVPGAAATTTSVSFKPVKLRLAVVPQITNDGAVIMKVDVLREFAGEVVDSATKAFPVNSRAASSKVLVKNGQTAVIGGIYETDETVGDKKVPWLGDIPVLGWLFKSRDVTKNKNELLVFITPRILSQPDAQVSSNPAIPTNGSADEFSEGEVQ